jgi:hypothetical protein
MTAQTDARGQRTDWRSDALGRMRLKTANALTAPDLTEYFYDETRQAGSFGASGVTFHNGGKLSRQVRGGVSQRQDHDANGFKVKDSATVDGVTHEVDTKLDPGGRVLARRWPDGDQVGDASGGAQWLYDGAGRLRSIPGHVNTLAYNGRGQVTSAAYANTVTTTNSYQDSRGWLMRVLTWGPSGVLQDLRYIRAATGRIGTVHAYGAGGAYNGLASFAYDYDDLDRLTLVHNGSDPALNQSLSYDAAHNMTANSALPGGGGYAYPAQGQGAVRPHAATQAGPYALAYDANGNRLTKSGGAISQSITWNYGDMISIT